MKKSIVFVLIILVALAVSCTQKADFKSIEEIKTMLETDGEFIKEAPFAERNFIPFSNDNPIERAVSYGCYRQDQAPWSDGPNEEEVFQDLTIISKHWNLIRVYNADDDTELIVQTIEKHNFPIKVMLGVWLENETDKPEKKQANITNTLRCIKMVRKYPETITAVNVGNETQVYWSWHKMDANDLLKYIRIIRQQTSIPITTADDYNFWNKPESKEVAAEIDFITTHIHPVWNGKTLETAIPWIDKTINIVKENHPEKQLVLGEIGWATNYNADKIGDGQQGTLIKGKIGVEAQAEFISQLEEWVEESKVTTFLFEAFDESWKGGAEQTGENEVEKNWGVFYEDRTPKKSFEYFIKGVK